MGNVRDYTCYACPIHSVPLRRGFGRVWWRCPMEFCTHKRSRAVDPAWISRLRELGCLKPDYLR